MGYWDDVESCVHRDYDMAATIACIMHKTQQATYTTLQSGYNSVTGSMIDAVDDEISGILYEINRHSGEVYDSIEEAVGDIFTSVSQSTSQIVDKTLKYSKELYDDFDRYMDNGLNAVIDYSSDLVSDFSKVMASNISKFNDLYSDVSDYVERSYHTIASDSIQYLNEIDRAVDRVVDNSSEAISEYYTEAVNTIESTYQSMAQESSRVYGVVEEEVLTLKTEISDYLEEGYDIVQNKLDNIFVKVSDMLDKVDVDVIPSLSDLVVVSKNIYDLFTSEKQVESVENVNSFLEEYLDIMMNPETNILTTIEKLTSIEGVFGIVGKVIAAGLVLTSTAFAVMSNLLAVSSAKNTDISYGVLSEYPITAFNVGEAVSLAARGFITKDECVTNNLKHGYSDKKSEDLVKAAKVRLDPERLMVLLRRGEITRSEMVSELSLMGYTESSITRMLKLEELIPPPADLISMSVREAFSQSFIEQFKTDEDFPSEFGDYMQKQGYSKDWALKYWIAHWRLPSAGQGFQMFQRDIINADQLDMLLKALDMSPFWREKMTEISYRVMTRVDVRRMYRLGVLSRDEVTERYRHMGFSPDDADVMTDFTVSYSKDVEDDDAIDVKRESLNQINRLWALGTIQAGEATQLLVSAGYSQELAPLLVESWGDEEEYNLRQEIAKAVVKKAVEDNLSQSEVVQMCAQFGLSGGEVDKIENLIQIARLKQTSVPTTSELRKMCAKGVLSVNEWENEMSSRGFSQYWIDKYRQYYDLG